MRKFDLKKSPTKQQILDIKITNTNHWFRTIFFAIGTVRLLIHETFISEINSKMFLKL